MPFINLKADQAGAVPVCRIRHRLTRATEIATTIFDILPFNRPVSFHDSSTSLFRLSLVLRKIQVSAHEPSFLEYELSKANCAPFQRSRQGCGAAIKVRTVLPHS